MTVIRDPNTGNGQHVDSDKRAHVNAVTITEDQDALAIGDSYNINTGTITLTDAVDTPVLFIQNNSVKELVVHAIAVGLSASTGGTGNQQPIITIVSNPTAGTIVSNATAVDMKVNRNLGSSLTGTSILAYKGATGNTMTDGDDLGIFYQTANGRLYATINLRIPAGSSIGVKIQPSTSNTSMSCYAAAVCHLATDHTT